MTLALIEQLSRKAGERAAKEKREPLIAFVDRDESILNCPNLGDYIPDEWKLIDQLFVDKTGFGTVGEPALTIDQFINKIKSGLGYAIIEEGEMQLYIGIFEKVG